MQKTIAASLLAVLLSGCVAFSNPGTTLATLQDAAIAARLTIRPVIDGFCAAELRKCNAMQLEVALLTDTDRCPGYTACDAARGIIIKTLQAVQFAIADANLALALGNDERFEDAVARVGELLEQVNLQMQLLGIIPEESVDGG